MKRITTLTIITVALFLITVSSHQIGSLIFDAKTIPNIILGFFAMCFIMMGFYYGLMAGRYLYFKVKNLFR